MEHREFKEDGHEIKKKSKVFIQTPIKSENEICKKTIENMRKPSSKPKVFKKFSEHIPLFEGRPTRELLINSDDVLNLKISLETSENLDVFIESI